MPWYLILPGVITALVVAGYVWLSVQYHLTSPALSRQINEAFAREHEQLKVTR